MARPPFGILKFISDTRYSPRVLMNINIRFMGD